MSRQWTAIMEHDVKGRKTILKLRGDHRVEHIDDERDYGNGIILTLKQGWSFDPLDDNRVAGADTIRETVAMLRSAKKFGGPYID